MASMKAKGTIEDYAKEISPPNAKIFREARALVKREAPGLRETLKWGQPMYVGKKDVIMFIAYNDHFNVAFLQGAHMKDPSGKLEGTGKGMRHVKVWHGEKVPEAVVKGFIKQALALDKQR